MSKVEKIKAEIDRLQETTMDENSNFRSQYDQGIFDGLSLLENFIDTLEQPIKRTPAEIEAAMQEVEEKSKLFTEAHKDDIVSNDTIDDLEKAAIEAFKQIVDSDKNNFLEIFKAGAEWQKEKMMEDAVDGEIYFNLDYLQYHINTEPLTHFHHGDKVKLIIVKEE